MRRIIHAYRIYRHRSGQDHLSLGCIGRAEQDSAAQEIFTLTVADLHRQPAGIVNRSRGLRGSAFLRDCSARARTSGATDPGAVRETIPQVEQERLYRRGSDRRGRDQAEHALCTDQNAGAARLAGHAPGAGWTEAASYGADQRVPISEAIAEAVTKQNMRFVQIKTQEQLDWQAMLRVRDRLMQRRTALINEI